MDLTPKQFESILKSVLADELPRHLMPLKDNIENLTTTVDGLAKKVDSYLTQEWTVHIHQAHPDLTKRIKACERKLGIKTS